MQHTDSTQPVFEPCCLPTTIGSLPHKDIQKGIELTFEFTPEIPGWPSFPKRSFRENMMVQFLEGIPGLVENGDHVILNTTGNTFPEQMTRFYDAYLKVMETGDLGFLEYFEISESRAAGFAAFIRRLKQQSGARYTALKGCVTGPFTLGTNLVNQEDRLAYYDDQLRDVIVKSAAMKSIWQINRLKPFCKNIIISIDEPALLNFGSQMFLTVGREDILHDLNEVAAAIHANGGLAGTHCEENTDWSLLMEADLDILFFDAYDHMQGLTLYPKELHAFFNRGGCLGWGILPTLNLEAAATETLDTLLNRFDDGMNHLVEKGFDKTLLLQRALITPSCGMGAILTPPIAERVFGLLQKISITLRNRYRF